MPFAKISQKNQIVIPKEAREKMKVHAGDELIVEALDGVTILLPKSSKIGTYFRGLGKGLYSKKYLQEERRSW